MNPNIKAYKRSQYTLATIIIILGLSLCLFGWLLVDMIGLVFALAFIIFGASIAFNCTLSTKYENFSTLRFICALIIIITGVTCLFNPAAIIHFAVSIIGICILAVAINNIFKFVKFKNNKKYLSFEFIKYCLNLIFGFLLLISPAATFEFLLVIFGIYLIYFGITFAIETHNADIFIA